MPSKDVDGNHKNAMTSFQKEDLKNIKLFIVPLNVIS